MQFHRVIVAGTALLHDPDIQEAVIVIADEFEYATPRRSKSKGKKPTAFQNISPFDASSGQSLIYPLKRKKCITPL